MLVNSRPHRNKVTAALKKEKKKKKVAQRMKSGTLARSPLSKLYLLFALPFFRSISAQFEVLNLQRSTDFDAHM